MSLHGIAAAVFGQPLLAIDPAEAKILADAVAELSKHYGDLVPDPKTQAWLNLAMILGTVYGPRGYLIYMGVKPPPAAAQPAPMTDPATVNNVFDMTGYAGDN